jgi:hypothetical protein
VYEAPLGCALIKLLGWVIVVGLGRVIARVGIIREMFRSWPQVGLKSGQASRKPTRRQG